MGLLESQRRPSRRCSCMSFCIVLYFREIFFLRLLINTIQLWGAYSGCQISDQKMRPIKQLTIKSVPVYSCAQDPVVGRTHYIFSGVYTCMKHLLISLIVCGIGRASALVHKCKRAR